MFGSRYENTEFNNALNKVKKVLVGMAVFPVWAEIDLSAISHNVREIRRVTTPARVMAVVKADGYGHGAVE